VDRPRRAANFNDCAIRIQFQFQLSTDLFLQAGNKGWPQKGRKRNGRKKAQNAQKENREKQQ
jgi:hypothetical protein